MQRQDHHSSPSALDTDFRPRVGADPIEQVFTIENHDEAFQIWRKAGLQQGILVHVDAHHDMWWASDPACMTIANYISLALKNDIVRQVVWVAPNQTWATQRNRRHVIRHLQKIAEQYPGGCQDVRVERNQISSVVFGKPLRICSLDYLPSIGESVLLDIDVDFLVIPRVSFGESDTYSALPWCWPEELVARLSARNLRSDLVTIAYSVEGGFTPLKWKYLGDELALHFRRTNSPGSALEGMRRLREGALAAHQGNPVAAEKKFHEARALVSGCAAPYFHLAQLYQEAGRAKAARESYQQALALDPSYRTPYNNKGLRYHSERRFRAAEREYRRTLDLDPSDAYAHLGLARITARRKRWEEAETLLRKALELNAYLVDAHRILGDVLVKQRRHEEAIVAYENSLKLALAGHKPLRAPIATQPEPYSRVDPDHCHIHARLARLYESRGAMTEAINRYLISIAGGHDGPLLRSRLAWLYLRRRQIGASRRELWQGLKRIPLELKGVIRRVPRAMRVANRLVYWALLDR